VSFTKDDKGKLMNADLPKPMVFNGHVVDGSEWADRHPGGAGPINHYMGTDVTESFQAFHQGNPAPLATLFGLQAGTTRL
jgi:cytochrome b involved in lipid metabolism